jgi:2-hydroxy-3-keto-5-methylthiopentenyl-1-phosphate phosphatase
MAAVPAGNSAPIDPAAPVVVFCDFDGTVTLEDTLVLLLDRFGRPRSGGSGWRTIEDDPDLPEIRKLQAEMDLLRITWPRALEYLHTVVRLRDGFREFHDLLRARDIPLRLVSGGFVEIIEAFLPRAEFPGVEILANRVRITDGRWVVLPADSPRITRACNHCKTWHLGTHPGAALVYIGDGSTDFCPAGQVPLVFARDSLARHLEQTGQDWQPYETFHDITARMTQLGLL